MQNSDPQILTSMLEFVHAPKIHAFEFYNFIFAFAGVEITFYTMSKKHMKRMKCEFQNAIIPLENAKIGSPNSHTNVRFCARV